MSKYIISYSYTAEIALAYQRLATDKIELEKMLRIMAADPRIIVNSVNPVGNATRTPPLKENDK